MFLLPNLFPVLVLGMATAAFSLGESIVFSAPNYAASAGIEGVDGWERYVFPGPIIIQNPPPFLVEQEGGTGANNQLLRCQSGQTYGVYRNFADSGEIVDVTWKWRVTGGSDAKICAGVASVDLQRATVPRATVCLEPNGVLTASTPTGTVTAPPSVYWTLGEWLYVKIKADASKHVYSVHFNANPDSLDKDTAVANLPLAGTNLQFGQFFIRAQDSVGTSAVDIDDVNWIGLQINAWTGLGVDGSWYRPMNWSRVNIPDSNDLVFFAPAMLNNTLASNKNCDINASTVGSKARILAIVVDSSYTGTIHLGSDTLDIILAADFGGGDYRWGDRGLVRFAYNTSQALWGSNRDDTLPPVLMAGPGVLSLAKRPGAIAPLTLRIAGYQQTGGTLNFNGFNLVAHNSFRVTGVAGTPSFSGLGGRTIVVGGPVQLDGANANNYLDLNPSLGWVLYAFGSVTARYANIMNSQLTAPAPGGDAINSLNGGLNSGWIFWSLPSFNTQPTPLTRIVGQIANYKVSAATAHPARTTYQWRRTYRGATTNIAAAAESSYTIFAVKRSDSGASYSCVVTNPAGSRASLSAALNVQFPAPTASPLPGEFVDSTVVTLIPPVTGQPIFYSLDQTVYRQYSAPIPLNSTTTISVYAVFPLSGGDTSTRANLIYSKVSSVKALKPVAEPTGGAFPDTFSVALTSGTPGSSIFYTVDGSTPTSGSTALPAGQRIPIRQGPTQVRGLATAPAIQNSDVTGENYTLLPMNDSVTLPEAIPPGGLYAGTAVVTLHSQDSLPEIFYRLVTNGVDGPLHRYLGPIVINSAVPVTLKASVVTGGKASRYASFDFTQGLAQPVFTPTGRDFTDSLRISIVSPDGGTLRFTRSGIDPTAADSIYTAPLKVDTTTTLKAKAFSGNSSSAVVSETYTLDPSWPRFNPPEGTYTTSSLVVRLSAHPKAQIRYTLDGSSPSGPTYLVYADSTPIILSSNTIVMAVAVAGTRFSSEEGAQYTFIQANVRDTLAPGDTANLVSSYRITNVGGSLGSFQILPSDSVQTIPGFNSVRFAVDLQAAGGAFPALRILGTDEGLGLYRQEPNNKARYLGPAVGGNVNSAGIHFVAADTSSPAVTLSEERFVSSGDSTQVTFVINDNVINLTVDATRSDNRGFAGLAINVSPYILTMVMKNAPDLFQALTVQVQARDGRNTGVFPPAPALNYAVAQQLSGSGPSVWEVGQNETQPWDLVGLPFKSSTPLILRELRSLNAMPRLRAMIYAPSGSVNYRELSEDEAIPFGKALWLANDQPVQSLRFPSLRTATNLGDSALAVGLSYGWNAIASPRLDVAFWPAARTSANSANYRNSPVKGLFAYRASDDTYVPTDTLRPWRGYWVFYNGGLAGTMVKLMGQAVSAPAAKASANQAIDLALLPDRGMPLFLGAESGLSDGAGVEDEPMLPLAVQGPWASLVRDRKAWMTDYVSFRPGSAMEWKLALSASPPGSRRASFLRPDASAWRLPSGYEVWAVSKQRGMRFEMKPGITIRNPEGFSDTLQVLAAPATWIRNNLGGVPTRVEHFSHRLWRGRDGLNLELHWPGEGKMRLEIFNVSGTLVSSISMDLPEGYYTLPVVNPVRGLALVRLTGRAGSVNIRWSGRFAVP